MTEQLVCFRSVVDLVQWSLHPLGSLTQWPLSVWDVVRSILVIAFFLSNFYNLIMINIHVF